MAKVKAAKGVTKSDIVRDYLRSNPKATVHDIVDDLKAHDISQALAQKIKYKDKGHKAGGRRPSSPSRAVRTTSPVAAAPVATASAGDESKADSIRRAVGGMGKRVRPRDVVAVLREEGIQVSFAQVGAVLKRMGMRRRSQRRATAAPGAKRASAATASAPVAISLDALIAAKKLADQLGSVQAAKQAMDALAKLS
ncbi:MAG TPA: hypothetical protein VF278_09350 [Pirellulales bacterium]